MQVKEKEEVADQTTGDDTLVLKTRRGRKSVSEEVPIAWEKARRGRRPSAEEKMKVDVESAPRNVSSQVKGNGPTQTNRMGPSSQFTSNVRDNENNETQVASKAAKRDVVDAEAANEVIRSKMQQVCECVCVCVYAKRADSGMVGGRFQLGIS